MRSQCCAQNAFEEPVELGLLGFGCSRAFRRHSPSRRESLVVEPLGSPLPLVRLHSLRSSPPEGRLRCLLRLNGRALGPFQSRPVVSSSVANPRWSTWARAAAGCEPLAGEQPVARHRARAEHRRPEAEERRRLGRYEAGGASKGAGRSAVPGRRKHWSEGAKRLSEARSEPRVSERSGAFVVR